MRPKTTGRFRNRGLLEKAVKVQFELGLLLSEIADDVKVSRMAVQNIVKGMTRPAAPTLVQLRKENKNLKEQIRKLQNDRMHR